MSNANEWNYEEMLAEAKALAHDAGSELVSRQAVAVLKVCADQLQALWAEVNRQQDQISALQEETERLAHRAGED